MREILFYIILLITNAVQAITGFAGTLLAMPPSIVLIGADKAKIVLNLMALLTCLVIALRDRRKIQGKILLKILVLMSVGMAAGSLIYAAVQTEILLYLYGAMIIVIAAANLRKKGKRSLSGAAAVLILLAAGIIHGMFVSGGALLVVYAANVLEDKDEFRATVASVWVFLNTLMLGGEAAGGQFSREIILLCAVSVIPAFAGVWIGNKLHGKINKEGFTKLTYGLLIVSGLLCFL